MRSDGLNSHFGVHQGGVDCRNIYTSEDVSVHVVDSSDVVDVSHIVEQVVRLIRQEVTVDNRRQEEVLYEGV